MDLVDKNLVMIFFVQSQKGGGKEVKALEKTAGVRRRLFRNITGARK